MLKLISAAISSQLVVVSLLVIALHSQTFMQSHITMNAYHLFSDAALCDIAMACMCRMITSFKLGVVTMITCTVMKCYIIQVKLSCFILGMKYFLYRNIKNHIQVQFYKSTPLSS